MSADVWIERGPNYDPLADTASEDDSLNITYNLSRMLDEAGFCGWNELVGAAAREGGHHILTVLDAMAKEPDKWRLKNPTNGWGSYDKCLQVRMRAWAERAAACPVGDRIGGWL